MAGLGTRALKLEIDGTDYSDSVSTVKVTAAESDSDFVTFASAALGGARTYKLALTMEQNLDTASLYRLIWDAPGSEVDVVVRPNGGIAAGASTPTFTGTAIVAEPDGDLLGGDADKSPSARFTTEVEWEFVAKPVIDVTP